jgi:hypothetical protein
MHNFQTASGKHKRKGLAKQPGWTIFIGEHAKWMISVVNLIKHAQLDSMKL